MITDTVPLAGRVAYLRDGGALNLAVSPASTGTSADLTDQRDGIAVDVSGVCLLIEADDLLDLCARPDDPALDEPLLALEVRKEMFPGFFADPYAHRVHAVAGFEDFARGTADGLRAMEVEGVPTLVSVGTGEVSWISPAYRLGRPILLAAAAWELATSRLTAPAGFRYRIELRCWSDGQDVESDAPVTTILTPDGGAAPADLRNRPGLELTEVVAFQIRFSATVDYDAAMHEFRYGEPDRENVGRPLLRAVHLLESITSVHTYHSLRELEGQSSEFRMPEVPVPQRFLYATIDLSALLVRDEHITLRVHPDRFTRVEARLDADVHLRPPPIEKQVGGS